ncbi:O-antigen ligase family protein [Candidatus Peregrinibacteria bacterium]|nr:O-antigen ligase family protein [Candidatus Peregrinibacteria bacterium]
MNITIGIGIILSFYAILQQFGIDPFNISDIDMASGRSFATAGHPNFLGQFLIFPIITLFVRIMKNAGGTKKILLTTALLFTFTGLLTTFNRASILGILLAICFLKLYKTSGKKRLKFVIIGLFLTIITASMLTYTGGLRSLNSRINLLQPIGALLIENPIFGSGIETFYKTYQKVATKEIYLTENLYDIPDRIHNEPLQVLLDQGAIGFLLYLMTIIFLIWIFIKHKLQTDNQITAYFAILAYLISMQFSFSLSLHMIFLLGMWAVLFADKNLGKQAFKVKTFKIPEKIIIWLLKPAALLLCIFYMYTAVSMLYADIYFAKGMKSYLKSSTEAEQFFAESLSLNPNSRYYLYNAANLLMGNTETLARLGKITNDGYHYDIAIANYLGKNGDLKGANKHFEIAAKKAPNWPLIWQMWGDFLFEEKMYTDAITKYEKLINLAPPYWKWPEKYRIFKKNHELFFISLQRLNKAYKELGDTRKSHELESYIFQ